MACCTLLCSTSEISRYPCPGSTLLSIFLADTHGRQAIVLPLPKVNFATSILLKTISLGIFIFFTVGFLLDVADVVTGGDFRESPYGKINPVISLISFCASQIGFFMAWSAGFFLVTKGREIKQCAESLDQLVQLFGLDIPHSKRKSNFRNLIRIRIYFCSVVILAMVRFFLAMQTLPVATFWTGSLLYAKIPLPSGIQVTYAHGTMLISILFYYPVNVLFTYLSSFLVDCAEAFHAENCVILHTLAHGDNDNSAAFNFLTQLRRIRSRQEKIYAAFDQVQETFRLKLFLDIAGNLSVVLSGIAWFSIWGADMSAQPPVSVVRHFLAAGIYLLTVWVVGDQPVQLFRQHERDIELLEKIVYKRQVTIRTKPSREEVGLTMALLERFPSKSLTFSAGGVVDLSPSAISTLVACIVSFTCFVIDRAENYRQIVTETKSAVNSSALLCGS
ncbi:uncharacterized protein LOC129580787 [Paramacrobiotus metropolitanus]|uniref:uncharacterized protein LOC129580787 n=1 Tax=Paramacrobiotus metropolitanus TaxID=2943436 RepID=UPI0024461002|nr:uncharacterized protein LOC129580787 [Paramacrobiotus metropolitanus]